MSHRNSRSIGAFVAAALAASATLAAQGPTGNTLNLPVAPVAHAIDTPATAAAARVPTVMLVAGGSTVIRTDFAITRYALTNPAIADATVIDPHQVLVDGKTAGNVSLILWGASDLVNYDLNVYAPTPVLQRQLRALFPNESIGVGIADEAIVLSGKVSSNAIALHAVEIAEKSSAKSKVVNLLQVPGGDQGQQVMLQVRVAEVSQRALMEVGATLFTGPGGIKNFITQSSTQQFGSSGFDGRKLEVDGQTSVEAKFTFSDLLNLFILNTKYDVGAVIKALRTRGYFQSLAEPTLIAYNGQEASFLAGGEIPVPIAQGLTGAVTVTYKEFGVRLTFRPSIAGDVIRMKVKPEVSSLDFANGISLQGFRIPALTTRRAETDVELRDGQSFAIGGLMNNLSQADRAAIPILGDLPIVGYFFKSKAERKERTELVVIITPRLVQPLNAPPPVPTEPGDFLPPPAAARPQNENQPARQPATVAEVGAANLRPATACVAPACQ